MLRVADPAPALAWTTSSPPNWTRTVNFSRTSSDGVKPGTWLKSGRMVMPACPPMTGTLTSAPSICSDTKVLARHTSNVVTPTSFCGLYTPAFFKTSAAIGTVLLTGLEMIAIMASGQYSAHPSTNVWTMLALVLNRSSRVIPGLRGTPAGMTTTSAPSKAEARPVFPVAGQLPGAGKCPVTLLAPTGMCERSAATPGVPTIS
mmetsp:Transcript_23796/g.67295  ORF Transcript_23796/g.67295 Transcript_23796/m.67295 type:complete len:203 (+) Transcript_23796:464-1072(+)